MTAYQVAPNKDFLDVARGHEDKSVKIRHKSSYFKTYWFVILYIPNETKQTNK